MALLIFVAPLSFIEYNHLTFSLMQVLFHFYVVFPTPPSVFPFSTLILSYEEPTV